MRASDLHSSNQEYDEDCESKGSVQGRAILSPVRFECHMDLGKLPSDIIKPQVDSSKALGVRKDAAC
jgi:hypothetical protein